MGLRREPQPPIPIVMPSRSSATAAASVVRLSMAPIFSCARGALPPADFNNETYRIAYAEDVPRAGAGLAGGRGSGPRRRGPRGRVAHARRVRPPLEPAGPRLCRARGRAGHARHARPPERARVPGRDARDLEARRLPAADLGAPARAGA